jgi:DNA primase
LWKDRIIFPIYYEQRLVSWVGRAIINPVNAPRYRILGEEEGALIGRNDLIYNADHATGGKILFVVEGPIDTLKMDFYGLPYDCTAVCPMGTRMSQSQAMQIAELSKRYDKFILLYDPGEIETVFIVMDMLGPFGLEVGEYPDFVDDDVGALEPKRVEKLIRSFL